MMAIYLIYQFNYIVIMGKDIMTKVAIIEKHEYSLIKLKQ